MEAIAIGITMVVSLALYAALRAFLTPSVPDERGADDLDAWAERQGLAPDPNPAAGKGWKGTIDGVPVVVTRTTGIAGSLTLTARPGLPVDAVVSKHTWWSRMLFWQPTGNEVIDAELGVHSLERAFVDRCMALGPALIDACKEGAEVSDGTYTIARKSNFEPASLDAWLAKHVAMARSLTRDE